MNNVHDRGDRRRSIGRTAVIVIVLLALAADAVLLSRYFRYRNETSRLRAGMTDAQRERADAVVAAERHRIRVELELIRRQARGDQQLHLAVNIDSGRMMLERDGVVLRDMNVRIGPESFRGPGDSAILVTTLGQRTVERVLGEKDAWELPATIFTARGLPVPEDRRLPGVLGAGAIVLNEGTVIYAIPTSGPLADSTFVLPGSVQVPAADLKAVSASIRPGMSVYFYR